MENGGLEKESRDLNEGEGLKLRVVLFSRDSLKIKYTQRFIFKVMRYKQCKSKFNLLL